MTIMVRKSNVRVLVNIDPPADFEFCKRHVLLHVLPVLLRFLYYRNQSKIPCMRTVFWEDNQLKMIDQRILPGRFEVISYRDHKSVAQAITDMVVRGAPAIGAAAAFGLALAAYESTASNCDDLIADLRAAATTLKAARPTAVNLEWAVDGMM